MQGFKESVKTDVPVSVNEVARVDVQLAVGGVDRDGHRRLETQLLQTDKADTHTELRSAAIAQLPLQQNRNYQTLINLVPGATPGRVQNSEVDTPGRALTTNVNGMNRNNNGTKTDGATNVNIWLPHHTMLVSPAETDRHRERQHEQLRRRAGHGRRRRDHGHHQVRHQRVPGLGVRVLQQREA